MSEQDRVHEASPIRLLRAKDEGLVARSAELSCSLLFCVLLGSGLLSIGSVRPFSEKLLTSSLQNVRLSWSDDMLASSTVSQLIFPFVIYLVTIAAAALATWHFQSPINLNPSKVAPDLSRVSPASAFGRIFSIHHCLKILTLVVGFLLAIVVAFAITWNESGRLASIANLDLKNGLAVANSLLQNTLIAAGAIILVLGVLDYVRERIRLANQLRMTDQERRDEARNLEMNPELRRRMFS